MFGILFQSLIPHILSRKETFKIPASSSSRSCQSTLRLLRSGIKDGAGCTNKHGSSVMQLFLPSIQHVFSTCRLSAGQGTMRF